MRRVSILLSVLALVLLLTSVDAGGPVTPVMRTDGTNADSPVFPGPVTVTGQTTLASTTTIGTSTAQAGYDLTVASGAHISGQTTLNDDTFADDITAKSLTVVGGDIAAPATAAFRLGTTNMLLASGTTMFGGGAGNAVNSGQTNTGFGDGALAGANAANNTAFGYWALRSCTSGSNVAIGSRALWQLVTGNNNVALGGKLTMPALISGNDNLAIGTEALTSLTAASGNVAVGALALARITTTNNNTTVGDSAGYRCGDLAVFTDYLTRAIGSIYIGANARAMADGPTNEMVFGTSVIGNGSNSLTLGNTSITKTVLRSGTCIGTNTVAVGYGATIASGCYVQGDVSADQFTDRSDAPESLAEAYAIVQSHEAKGGKVDHSKLHSSAWGRKFRVVETGKTLTKTREIAPAEEGGKATIEEYSEPEKIVVSEPDQQGRNLSMVISAQALVIQDLTRRLEALEAR